MTWRAGLLLATVAIAGPLLTAAGRDAVVAAVDADERTGSVYIRYSDGTTIAAPKGPDQKVLSRPALAEDGRTVGWLGEYDTCCQCYPIPRQLVIWRSGRVIRRIDAAAMIWNWRFYRGGRQVGFADGPTHGSAVPYSYKLYDVARGLLLSEIGGHQQGPAAWATMLAPARSR